MSRLAKSAVFVFAVGAIAMIGCATGPNEGDTRSAADEGKTGTTSEALWSGTCSTTTGTAGCFGQPFYSYVYPCTADPVNGCYCAPLSSTNGATCQALSYSTCSAESVAACRGKAEGALSSACGSGYRCENTDPNNFYSCSCVYDP